MDRLLEPLREEFWATSGEHHFGLNLRSHWWCQMLVPLTFWEPLQEVGAFIGGTWSHFGKNLDPLLLALGATSGGPGATSDGTSRV